MFWSQTLRRLPTSFKYFLHRRNKSHLNGCGLCNDKIIKQFKFWKIINNKFPYDKIAKEHHMLIPIRHCKEEDLSKEELDELKEIKKGYINDYAYNYILESTNKVKSIPEHFHLHLLVLK